MRYTDGSANVFKYYQDRIRQLQKLKRSASSLKTKLQLADDIREAQAQLANLIKKEVK
jgi:hypothetical protein